ncbi:hypothetical protein MNQ96_09825 [Sphingopyxis granuli]|uniref:hypothetical protein n=1 Tax=Sphingopyxis granuli TaxID=267128 RepID=UPI001F537F81|nr:hypothetical protein [Sphingopyxis granuli]UNK77893.1 hypothetical protein MNQ96_09825 [Sphingopyxis granuli]
MAKRKSNRPNKSGRNENPTGRFARLPHEVMLSAAYRSLTPNARALLVEMMAMENGQNNGSLWLSIRDAAARIGLVNKESVGKAFDELTAAGLIALTKEAHFSVKAAETSRARCWRLTFLHWVGVGGRTDEWRQFVPANKSAARRANMGLAADATYRKALAQEKLPVLNLRTTRDARANIEAVAVHELRTAKPDLDAKLPKSVGHDLRTHTAVTMGDGGAAFCWRDGKTLRMLPDILPTLTPDRAQQSRIAA